MHWKDDTGLEVSFLDATLPLSYKNAGPLILDLCVPSFTSLEFGGIKPASSMASHISLPGLASSVSAFKLLNR
jgi:hypothetical protein